MKPILSLFFCIFLLSAASQEVIVTRKFPLFNENLIVSLKEKSDTKYEIQFDSIESKLASFVFESTLSDPQIFKNDFLNALAKSRKNGFLGEVSDGDLDAKSAELFYLLQAAASISKNISKPPIAGTISFKCQGLVKLDTDYEGPEKIELSVPVAYESIQIEFNEGFIENIVVSAILNVDVTQKKDGRVISKGTALKFENYSPIGFSSKAELGFLFKYNLSEKFFDLGALRMRDVLSYVQNHNLDGRDLSPKNEVRDFEPCNTYTLNKEETSKLFELNIYSDFLGFDQTSPNGLIQIELNKRININTYRYPLWWRNNGGFFNFVEPNFSLTKIEENNRKLLVEKSVSNVTQEGFEEDLFVETLDVKNTETYSIGLTLNGFVYDLPQFKTTLYLNGGVSFGRTLYVDSLLRSDSLSVTTTGQVREGGINNFSLFQESRVEIKPDTRFGITVRYLITRFKIRDERITQVDNSADYLTASSLGSNHFGTFEIGAFVKPNPNSNLFFRYRYNYVFEQPNNFQQLQVGYSTYLLKNR